ncbi:uncharacterized protein [Aristolochia californica]|uniref:uncharacterized protein n=1 Tax=Aristolochia californica TaxID=171875 RepID=UPI0035D60268
MVYVDLDWTEAVPHADDRVEYALWTTSNDERGPKCDMLMQFGKNTAVCISAVCNAIGIVIWTYMVGVDGDEQPVHSDVSATKWQSENLPISKILFWYRTTFKAPLGLEPVGVNLQTMDKGEAWVNGRSIGRFWSNFSSALDGCGAVSGFPFVGAGHIIRGLISREQFEDLCANPVSLKNGIDKTVEGLVEELENFPVGGSSDYEKGDNVKHNGDKFFLGMLGMVLRRNEFSVAGLHSLTQFQLSTAVTSSISRALEPKRVLIFHIAAHITVKMSTPQQHLQPEKHNAAEHHLANSAFDQILGGRGMSFLQHSLPASEQQRVLSGMLRRHRLWDSWKVAFLVANGGDEQVCSGLPRVVQLSHSLSTL